MFCSSCGEQNPENAVFCRNCGKKLKEETKKAEPIETPITNQNTNTNNNNSNDDWKCCCGCLIAIFIIFALASLMRY